MQTTTIRKNSKVRILVVDDHPNTATTLSRAISQLDPDIEVIAATSGKSALDSIQNNGVDLLITDMMMPEMNGMELIEKMQSHPAGRPTQIVLITAYDVPGLKETARRLKVNEIIIKPVKPERICQIVTTMLDGIGQSSIQKAAESPHQFKILVADDVPDNVILLSRYLENEGYAFITAANGVEALEKVREEKPDLVLLDVNMPLKDGFEVLQEIRAEPTIKHIPVIILTAARQNPIDMQTGLKLGADDYIIKPFDRRELMARIQTKLRVKESEDAIKLHNKELNVLPEIGKELSARLDINELIDIVLHRTVETLGAMQGHMVILNPKEPIYKEYHIPSSVFQVPKPPLDVLLNLIKETRQSLIIDDTHQDPRWAMIANDPTRSGIVVPILGHFDLIGLLVLTHERIEYFKQEHQTLLEAIASQAAIAAENAQLYNDISRERKKLAAVLQSAADAILVFDADTRFSLLNPAGEKLFTDYGTKLGMPLARGCGYDALIELLDETFTSGKLTAGEIKWPDLRTFSVLITPIEEGGCVAILHDVTQFKDLDRIKNEFVSTATHDLKNPIGVITGFTELLVKVGPLNDDQLDFVENIRSAAENMNELVQNLLELAKIDMGMDLKQKSLDMNVLVAEILDEFQPQAKTKEQKLILKKTAGRLIVRGDALQLQQALRNLVGNAIKYTPVRGSIYLSLETDDKTVFIHVRDTGYGISAEDLPFIFDRFYRANNDEKIKKIEGNGLGLAIVKSTIERHNGRINVQSELGKGSCFTFTLPLMQTVEDPIALQI